MHSVDSPTWEKELVGYDDDPSRADWWTVDSQGNMSITAPSVQRTTTYRLGVTATNDDGEDTGFFNLTIIYVPQPPRWADEVTIDPIPEFSVIGFSVRSFITNTVTDVDLISVSKVDSGAPDLFLEAQESPPVTNVGLIRGATNAGGNDDVKGTADFLPTGQPATINTVDAPQVTEDREYTIVARATNVGLITTPECPDNFSDKTFTITIADTVRRIEPPAWVEN